MKILSISIALSFAASIYAGELISSLSAVDETQSVSVSTGVWVNTRPAHSDFQVQRGEYRAVAFGREAIVGDMAQPNELADLQLIRLAKATEVRQLAGATMAPYCAIPGYQGFTRTGNCKEVQGGLLPLPAYASVK